MTIHLFALARLSAQTLATIFGVLFALLVIAFLFAFWARRR